MAISLCIEVWFGFGAASWYLATYHTIDGPALAWFAFGALGPVAFFISALRSGRTDLGFTQRIIRAEKTGLVVAGGLALLIVFYFVSLVATGGF